MSTKGRLFALVVMLGACHPSAEVKVPASSIPAATATTPSAKAKPALEGPRHRTLLVDGCAIVRPRAIACIFDDRSLKDDVRWQPLTADFDPQEAFVHLERRGDRLCALMRPSGRVACWNTDKPNRRAPAFFPAPELEPVQDAVDFALLQGGMCALDGAGIVRCWGDNKYGQLGDGSRTARGKPRAVELPAPAVDLETSYRSACALLDTGSIYCWGENDTAGDPRRLTPEKIQGLGPVAQLEDMGWARLRDGTWAKWKLLEHVPERGFTTAEAVVAPRARSEHGDCWMDGTALWCEAGRDEPPEMYFDDVVEFTHDSMHSACVRRRDGSAWCRGSKPTLHVQAPGVELDEATQVPGLGGVTQVAAASKGACALHDGGKVSCWGSGEHLPHHERQRPSFVGTPTEVPLPGAAERILVAGTGACALVEGSAHCWGGKGQPRDLGPAVALTSRAGYPCADDGTTLRCLRATPRDRGEQVRPVLRPDGGTVEAWGFECSPGRGRVDCERRETALNCPDDPKAAEPCSLVESSESRSMKFDAPLRVGRSDTLIVGAGGSCALSSSGHLRCSGFTNAWPHFEGFKVDVRDIVDAAAGSSSVCGVGRGGKLSCWESEQNDGGAVELGIEDAVSVSLGGRSGYVVRRDGSVWSWGPNRYGQRGLGGWEWKESEIPVVVPQLGPDAEMPEVPKYR